MSESRKGTRIGFSSQEAPQAHGQEEAQKAP